MILFRFIFLFVYPFLITYIFAIANIDLGLISFLLVIPVVFVFIIKEMLIFNILYITLLAFITLKIKNKKSVFFEILITFLYVCLLSIFITHNENSLVYILDIGDSFNVLNILFYGLGNLIVLFLTNKNLKEEIDN